MKQRRNHLIADPNDPRHGTSAGYWAHRNAGITACDPCKRAAARYEATRAYEGKERRIDGTGTRRRLQALVALGWTYRAIAVEAGWSERSVWRRIAAHDSVYASTAAQLAEAYDRLCMIRPEGVEAHRARLRAQRRGWPPPLAWDDIDNDEAPVVAEDDMSPKERRDAERLDWLELADSEHRTVTYAAEGLGLSREGLNVWCRTRGHMDLYWRLVNRDSETGENQHTAA